jgi:coatomer subunit beta
MQTFLAAESDATCKRNAFVFLASCAMDKAVEWILGVYDVIGGLDEGLQMSIIEVIRADCKNDSTNRVRVVIILIRLFPDKDLSHDTFGVFLNSSMRPHMLSNTRLQRR